jgi:hypothetical protein
MSEDRQQGESCQNCNGLGRLPGETKCPACNGSGVFLWTDLSSIPDTPCGRAFKQAMVGHAYGEDALTSAWAWFQEGWKAPPKEPMREGLEQARLCVEAGADYDQACNQALRHIDAALAPPKEPVE